MNNNNIADLEKEFLGYVQKIEHYGEVIALIDWDMHTKAPKKGKSYRSEALGTLSEEAFRLTVSSEMKEYLDRLSETSALAQISPITAKTVEYYKEEYEHNRKIPAERHKAYTIAVSKAGSAWEEAKNANDFPSFLPHLKTIVELKKEFLGYWGYEGHPYNTFVDRYERGMTVEVLDEVFSQLRSELVPLLQEIMDSPHKPDTSFVFKPFSLGKQEEFNYLALEAMGYDFAAGRLDNTMHPFATGLNPGDVRVTTKYDENDFRTTVFGTIHEGGHALYEQNISPELANTPLHRGTSSGVHESQSLFWENFVARNKHYWVHFYPKLQTLNPTQFAGISLEAFYRGINVAEPSFIRIEADELTYALHVILRYEIEKGLITDQIQVEDLPQIWNDKMEEYLGVRPPTDSQGVLQDVHWSLGEFGYFPTYALGYIYAAQIKHAMDRDMPDFEEKLSRGELYPIKEWLSEKIHRHGKMKKPMEIIREVTGEGVNAKYLVEYLQKKYRDIYRLG